MGARSIPTVGRSLIQFYFVVVFSLEQSKHDSQVIVDIRMRDWAARLEFPPEGVVALQGWHGAVSAQQTDVPLASFFDQRIFDKFGHVFSGEIILYRAICILRKPSRLTGILQNGDKLVGKSAIVSGRK